MQYTKAFQQKRGQHRRKTLRTRVSFSTAVVLLAVGNAGAKHRARVLLLESKTENGENEND